MHREVFPGSPPDREAEVFPWVTCNECGQAVVDMPTHLRFHRITHMAADEQDLARRERARRLGAVLVMLCVIAAFLAGAVAVRYL